jgi:putative copper resistance protein D
VTLLAALKASLFVGVVLLVGAGAFARFVGPELVAGARRRLRRGLLAGAGLLLAASFAEAVAVMTGAIGAFELERFAEYLLYTRHGQLTLARAGLVLALLALGLGNGRLPRTAERVAFVASSLALLGTISAVSHSGVMGVPALLGDLVHLAAASLWAGALGYYAWAPCWREREALLSGARRLGSIGVWSVVLLGLTGAYLGLLHVSGFASFATPYGSTLLLKVKLVSLTVALAFVNRFALAPLLESEARRWPLKLGVRLESLLLVGVLLVTGALTTLEPPHDHLGSAPPPAPATAGPVLVGSSALPVGGGILLLQPEDGGWVTLTWQGQRGAEVTLAATSMEGGPLELLLVDEAGTQRPLAGLSLAPQQTIHLGLLDHAESWLLQGEVNGTPFTIQVSAD